MHVLFSFYHMLHIKNAQRKMVRHFSYLKWPDMGCPETPELLLEFVKAVKQYGNRGQESSNGPMIVHCR
jgi:protein tyrosine phosphatase